MKSAKRSTYVFPNGISSDAEARNSLRNGMASMELASGSTSNVQESPVIDAERFEQSINTTKSDLGEVR